MKQRNSNTQRTNFPFCFFYSAIVLKKHVRKVCGHMIDLSLKHKHRCISETPAYCAHNSNNNNKTGYLQALKVVSNAICILLIRLQQNKARINSLIGFYASQILPP